jgi:hypothetical protein
MADFTHIDVSPVSPLIGAEISGFDLSAPLDSEVIAEIQQALLTYLVGRKTLAASGILTPPIYNRPLWVQCCMQMKSRLPAGTNPSSRLLVDPRF